MATAIKEVSLKAKLTDILVDISWVKISKKYFGKSSSWIYDKLEENEEFKKRFVRFISPYKSMCR